LAETPALPEIPRLYLDRIEVEIRDVDVAGLESVGCSIARIEAETAVMECVSTPVRRQKGQLASADAREGLREVGELLGDEMDDVPFPLNAAVDAVGM